jgi:hypothetical protein
VLGFITLVDPIYIFVKNLATGYIYRQDSGAISSYGYGSVVLDLQYPAPSFYNPNSLYEIWVTAQSNGSDQREDISIGNESASCLEVSFEKYYGDSPVEYDSHTLELE